MRRKRLKSFLNAPLDKEERELMELVESGRTVPVPEEEMQAMKKAVVSKNVSIRMQTADIEGFKKKASAAGIPYQTLINSVLHRYLVGSLVPKESI